MSGIHQTKQGHWVLDGDPWISKWVEDLGRLDHDRMIDTLCSLIPVGGVVIDAGAAIGDHTVFYGHAVGPSGLVVAFEPNPDAFACLVMNTRLQPWVEPLRMALGAVVGSVSMDYRPENIWASGVSPSSKPDSFKILAKTIDSIVLERGLKRLDFIKMDVEGFEPEVIAGAIHSIQKFKPVIAAEINKGALARYGWDADDIYLPLFGLDYKLKMLDPTHTLELPQFDCLFMP